MTEIDLIPADYRQYLRLRWIIRGYIVLFSTLVLFIAGARIWTSHLSEVETDTIKDLETGENFILNQKKQVEELTGQRTYLKTRLNALDALRGGVSAEKMFVIVSRAINPSTWITNLKFLRSGEVKEEEPENKKIAYHGKSGSKKSKSTRKSWQKKTHMEIEGQAFNHSALVDFVKTLLKQPEIEDVHVLKTGTRVYAYRQVIEYSLAVEIIGN